ncbi:MAG: hypothetical protein AAF663_00435 [Planctomycetota bacterium]
MADGFNSPCNKHVVRAVIRIDIEEIKRSIGPTNLVAKEPGGVLQKLNRLLHAVALGPEQTGEGGAKPHRRRFKNCVADHAEQKRFASPWLGNAGARHRAHADV